MARLRSGANLTAEIMEALLAYGLGSDRELVIVATNPTAEREKPTDTQTPETQVEDASRFPRTNSAGGAPMPADAAASDGPTAKNAAAA